MWCVMATVTESVESATTPEKSRVRDGLLLDYARTLYTDSELPEQYSPRSSSTDTTTTSLNGAEFEYPDACLSVAVYSLFNW